MSSSTKNPNTPDNNGATPIFVAAESGHTEIVKLLIPYSEVPNSGTHAGDSPRSLALLNKHHDIADLFEQV